MSRPLPDKLGGYLDEPVEGGVIRGPVLEAVGSAVVVASTAVCVVPDVGEDRFSGHLCTSCDVDAPVRMIVRTISAFPPERAKMLRRGTAVIRERHDARRAAATFARLLHQIVTADLVEARQ